MSKQERLTTIVGIRVFPSWKAEAQKEARRLGKTLSEFLYDCIDAGWEKVVTKGEVVKQESAKNV